MWDGEDLSGMGDQVKVWLIFLSKLCQACEWHGSSFHEHSVAQVDDTQDSKILSAFPERRSQLIAN